jgi:hypothetical protein
MAAVELSRRWDTEYYGRASRSRQVDGEVAAFVRVCMQAAEAQLLVTKQSLGDEDSRVALDRKQIKVTSSSGSCSTPGSAPATTQRRILTTRVRGQAGVHPGC